MSSSSKRKLSDAPLSQLKFEVETIKAGKETWRDLSQEVVDRRAVVVKHEYFSTKLGQNMSVKFSHTHGEFNKRLRSSSLDTHNISTSISGDAPRSFPKILDDLGNKHGASDALRVLKGTHLTRGLQSGTPEKRIAAVELAHEIGISEYARGTTNALFDAAINLYRIKHGNLAKADFADHTKGYTGAGKGGAERLRALGTPKDVSDQYKSGLKSIYNNHAVKKPGKGWAAKGYSAWLNHKFAKWTKRER